MMKALMSFTFPEMSEEEWKAQLLRTHSKRDFQANFIYHAIHMVLQKVRKGLLPRVLKIWSRIPRIFI
jgi:hypothetical protein